MSRNKIMKNKDLVFQRRQKEQGFNPQKPNKTSKPFSYNEYIQDASELDIENSFITKYFEEAIWRFVWHYHPNEIEIILPIVKIRTECLVGDYSNKITNENVFLIPPNVPHSFYNIQKEYKGQNNLAAYSIRFDCKLFQQLSPIITETKDLQIFLNKSKGGLLFYGATAKKLKYHIHQLTSQNNDGSIDSVCMFLKIIEIMSTSEECKTLSAKKYKHPSENKNQNRVNKIFNFLHENLENEITLHEISKTVNMSIPNLCFFFKQSTGKTIISYLNEIRITYASMMLIETDKTVLEIAYDSGYQNLSYFNRQFKKHKAMTPTQYRKEKK
jgi:AraC-like DNA-binding protein/mannose-6-phosphate isomerase-like protein (cupin superfamily)